MHGSDTPEGGADASSCCLIKDKDVVIFDINHGYKVHFVKISAKAKFQMGRTEVPSTALIGHPYGTLFEIDQETEALKPVPYVPAVNEWKLEDHAFERMKGHTTSSGIHWSPSNQKLAHEDIKRLQADGVHGAKLVETIENNSSTFEDRTVLAQKKFRTRKERKHVLVGCARRPTAKTLSEAYYTPKHIKRIGNLRPDSLAMALCLANVGAHQRVLVIEQSAGLVAGAVMERLGGYGECCVGHVGKNAPNLSIVDGFNFDARVGGVLTHGCLVDLLGEVRGLEDRTAQFTYKGKRFAKEEEAERARKKAKDDPRAEVGTGGTRPAENGPATGGPGEDDHDNAGGDDGTAMLASPSPQGGRFTSLIITATNFSQKSLLLASLPLLAPSASFAVVSPTLQPLVDTMNLIRVRGFAVATTINEPWKRDIQVLPKRTHPDMNMDHGGGYILSGTVSKRGRWVNLRQFTSDNGGPNLRSFS